LVTGAAGFLGRVSCMVLAEHGHNVTALIRGDAEPPGVHILRADLRDQEAVARAFDGRAFDAVCHLAARSTARESFADPVGYYQVNVAGTANLLGALDVHGFGGPVVYTSTNAVYGSVNVGALSEELTPQPGSPYAASKLAAEHLLAYQAGTGRIGTTVLRCFNIAGAYRGVGDPDTTRIISAALRTAAGDISHVTLNGDGSAVREFIHVADVADAIHLAITATEAGRSRALNVGTGEGASMRQVLATARVVTGHPIPVVERPPVDEPHTLVADVSRIEKVLEWRPRRSAIETIVRDAWAVRRQG
jgi:UDP-glucose 4-epimerase